MSSKEANRPVEGRILDRNRSKPARDDWARNAIFYHMLWFYGESTTIGRFVPSKIGFSEGALPDSESWTWRL